MMKIVLLLIGVILLAGAGFGGYVMYTEYMPAEDETDEAEAEPIIPLGPPAFLKLKPMVVPVIGRRGVEQFITLGVTLEMANQDKLDAISAQMPRLVDAFLTTLYGEIDKGSVVDGSLVKVEAVKSKLLEAANKVFGEEGGVMNVLVQSIHQRRI